MELWTPCSVANSPNYCYKLFLEINHNFDLKEKKKKVKLDFLVLSYVECKKYSYVNLKIINKLSFQCFSYTYSRKYGLIMNTTAFIVLSATPVNATSMSVYLRVLAITDNGVLLFNFAVGVSRSQSSVVNRLYLDNQWLCGTHKVMIEIFFLLSTWMVVALTMERLMVVSCPFKLGFRLNARSAAIIVIILCSALFPIGLTKLQYAGFEVDSSFEYQACNFGTPKDWDEFLYVYIAMTTWVPLFFIIFCNLCLLTQIRNSVEARSNMTATNGGVTESVPPKTHKTTRTLLLLSATYVVLLLPLAIVETIEIYWDVVLEKQPESDRLLYIEWLKEKILLKRCRGLCFALYQWNFAINFLLYCLSGKKFRHEVIVLMHQCWLLIHPKKTCIKTQKHTSTNKIGCSRTAVLSPRSLNLSHNMCLGGHHYNKSTEKHHEV
ncbi:hypothetical protein C0J52_13516 [Blattella germanica]|nr:hypothetical protein C0J52_13516 [Blattella germanica]